MNTTRLEEETVTALTGLLYLFGIALSLGIVTYAYTGGVIPRRQYTSLVLGGCLAIYYVHRTREVLRSDDLQTRDYASAVVMLTLAAAGLAATGYVFVEYFRWLDAGRLLVFNDVDLLVGGLLVVLVTDVTTRNYGLLLGGVVVASLLYGYLGQLLPGFLSHSGMSIEDLIVQNTITLDGVFGFLPRIGATWIAIFIVFAGLVEGFRGFDYILEIGERTARRSKYGLAQIAIISSMLMGMMMGSSASNVATTGSFTIPLMDDRGIPSRIAAAVESMASTGGQILPPIMGSAAFIMADFIGVSYATIALSAIVPSIMFYVTVSLGTHYLLVGRGIEVDAPPAAEDPVNIRPFVVRGVQYVIPLLVLFYTLMVAQMDPMVGGLYTVATIFGTRAVQSLADREVRRYVGEALEGLVIGARNLAPLMAVLAALGIVVKILSTTGTAQRLAIRMVLLSGDVFVVVLLMAMVVSLLFGLGMPTPAAYVLVATILAPVLVQGGTGQIPAHFFVFYFALLSAITPPIALAVTIAAGIANTDFLRTAKTTLVLGGPTFLIPFVFIANPSIMVWELPLTIIQSVAVVAAMIMLVNVVTGYSGFGRLSSVGRLVLAGLAVVTVFAPRWEMQLGCVVVYGLYQMIGRFEWPIVPRYSG